MPEPEGTIPQPVGVTSLEPPPIPPELETLPPGPLRVVAVVEHDTPELAIIYKRTYEIVPGEPCRIAESQIPLDQSGETHDELEPGLMPSARALPEVVGLKAGTDVVVQAKATPPRPATTMTVEAQIGGHRHVADVIGRRFVDVVGGRLVFSDPERFDEMPLRYENAYGGRDLRFERKALEEARRLVTSEQWRRGGPTAEAMVKANHALMYPRNRFGKGYVLGDDEADATGRELPGIERPDDRLTPERLMVKNPLSWVRQPLPIGFDFLDPLSFPRSAMLGMPPPGVVPAELDGVREVERGLVPRGFCLGNIFAGPMDRIPGLIHPWATRCASLGLWMEFLRGDEPIVLFGMDAASPALRIDLPGEAPVFSLPARGHAFSEVVGQLHLVRINVPERRLCLVWVGRVPRAPTPLLTRPSALIPEIRVDFRPVR